MAEKLADLSGDERAKRVAELKAKMQAAAEKAKAGAEAEPKAAAPKQAPAPAAVVAPVEPVAAPVAAEATKVVSAPSTVSRSNGSASGAGTGTGNGAGKPADVAVAVPVAYPPPIVEETAEQRAQKEMTRREFLTYAWGAALGLLALEGGVGTFFFLMPRFKAGEFGGKFFLGPETALPPAEAAPRAETAGKFWLVNTAEGPKALYMVCTHLGCLYKWAPSNNRFECPCHGSKFSREGLYIEGPAPRSLDTFPLTIENGEVVVDTGKKVVGGPAIESPARVVPT